MAGVRKWVRGGGKDEEEGKGRGKFEVGRDGGDGRWDGGQEPSH